MKRSQQSSITTSLVKFQNLKLDPQKSARIKGGIIIEEVIGA